MAELKGSKTHQHLKDAFAGESQANRRYLYFANKADMKVIQRLLTSLGIPLKGKRVTRMDIWIIFLRLEIQQLIYQLVLQKIISPLRLQGNDEYTDMYPGMAKDARDEGFDEIADWFETLAKAERSHANKFQKALDSIEV